MGKQFYKEHGEVSSSKEKQQANKDWLKKSFPNALLSGKIFLTFPMNFEYDIRKLRIIWGFGREAGKNS